MPSRHNFGRKASKRAFEMQLRVITISYKCKAHICEKQCHPSSRFTRKKSYSPPRNPFSQIATVKRYYATYKNRRLRFARRKSAKAASKRGRTKVTLQLVVYSAHPIR